MVNPGTQTDELTLSCYCRKEFEERKQKGEANVDGAGLRQFGAGSTDVCPISKFESDKVLSDIDYMTCAFIPS